MTAAQLATRLLGSPLSETETAPAQDRKKVDPKIKVLADRMALKIFHSPSLQAFLADYGVEPTGKPDGEVKIKLAFVTLPKEVLPDLQRLLSLDYFNDSRLVSFTKDGHGRTGVEITVTPKDLPGSAEDYSY